MRHDYSACCTSINHTILLFELVAQSGSHVADNWRLRDWHVPFRTLVWKPEVLGDLDPDPGGRAEGVVLRPLACWNCGLESAGAWISVSWVLCLSRKRSLRWADSSSRGVLPSVCVCVSLSVIKYNSNPLHLQRLRRLRTDKKRDLGVDGGIIKMRLRKAIQWSVYSLKVKPGVCWWSSSVHMVRKLKSFVKTWNLFVRRAKIVYVNWMNLPRNYSLL